MSKNKKGDDKKQNWLAAILLITAVLDLIRVVLEIIRNLTG